MRIKKDGKGQPYIQWEQPGIGSQQNQVAYKRAWIQKRHDETDWAGTVRYLNVVRCNEQGHPSGNPADFPIYNELPDEQILLAFVYATNAITGLPNWDQMTKTLATYQPPAKKNAGEKKPKRRKGEGG